MEGGRGMTDQPTISSELVLHQAEDGRTRIQCRFEGKLSIRQVELTALEVG
jgi:hypothetical protein